MSADTRDQAAPRDFVHNVLIVDDQAYAGAGDDARDWGVLPTADIADAMADAGLSCTFLPSRGTVGPELDRVLGIARQTDVVVLDWMLAPGSGGADQDSLPILEAIVRADVEDGGRLRLFVLYSGFEGVTDILSDVHELFDGLGIPCTDSGFGVSTASIHVEIFGKPNSRARDVPKVTAAELPSRIVDLFLERFGSGLLRRVALAGIASSRRYAHELLMRVPPELDPAFMSHRAMVGDVAAEEFARNLIADEIATVIAHGRVERWVSEDEVRAAVDKAIPDGTEGCSVGRAMLTPLAARQFLVSGDRPPEVAKDPPTLTTLFSPPGTPDAGKSFAAGVDEAFTVLAMYSNHPSLGRRITPRLGLGTVLARDDRYYVCMQPLCDSVRLDPGLPTAFPLLPLEAPRDDGRFDFILPGEAPRVRMRIDARLARIVMVSFSAGTRRTVDASLTTSGALVFLASDGGEFSWIADIRIDRAHRLAAALGNSAGRVGIDEPEWSRKMAFLR